MPEYRKTNSFQTDYQKLIKKDLNLKKSAIKAFQLFKQNPNHPSLQIHELDSHKGIWAGHITEKYVFTFQKQKIDDGELIYWFRRIGDHSIYDSP